MSKDFDGAESRRAGADGRVPQAWVWSQYKGVLPGVKSRGSTLAKESVPTAASGSQTKVELPQSAADRQSAPEPEALISRNRMRRPLAVAAGLASAVLIIVALAWFFLR